MIKDKNFSKSFKSTLLLRLSRFLLHVTVNKAYEFIFRSGFEMQFVHGFKSTTTKNIVLVFVFCQIQTTVCIISLLNGLSCIPFFLYVYFWNYRIPINNAKISFNFPSIVIKQLFDVTSFVGAQKKTYIIWYFKFI